MLDHAGFDLWANTYDETVSASDEQDEYPFAGYTSVLSSIYRFAVEKGCSAILDIGFGTGSLTTKLNAQGCQIYGQDFSEQMLRLAAEKMPGACLYAGDFSKGLCKPLQNMRYDLAIATYSLHHLSDAQKRELIASVLSLLRPDGCFLIGDVAFETRAQLEACRDQAGEEWDDDEIYFVYEEWIAVFPKMRFIKHSFCAGVLMLEP